MIALRLQLKSWSKTIGCNFTIIAERRKSDALHNLGHALGGPHKAQKAANQKINWQSEREKVPTASGTRSSTNHPAGTVTRCSRWLRSRPQVAGPFFRSLDMMTKAVR
jgi:hypothetical protein